MKRLIVAVLGLLLCAGMAKAQTCTPVTISYPNAAPSDDGHGNQDNWQFGIYWWSFEPPQTHEDITVTAGPYFFNDAVTGVVNVKSGFGGCPLGTYIVDVVHQYVLTDTGTGANWKYLPQGNEYDCTLKSGTYTGCPFSALWDPHVPGTQYRTDLVSGHHYRLDSDTYATILNVGTSLTYTYSVYITVE